MTRLAHRVSERALALHHMGQSLQVYKYLAGILLAIVVAYLAVADMWMVALALLAVVPGYILLQKFPLLGLLGWLLLAQFLMNTETTTLRMLYWVVHRGLPPATIAIVVAGSLFKISDRKLPSLSWPEVAMLGYLTVTQFSIVYLNPTALATTYWLYDRIFIPMCLYLLVRLLAPSARDWELLALAAFIICMVQAAFGMLSWAAPSLVPSMWRGEYIGDRTVGTLINPGVYTNALAFSSLIVVHAALNAKRPSIRAMYVAAFVLANYCIFISFTRSSWLGAVVTSMGLFTIYPRFMVRLFVILALLIGIVGGGAVGSGLLSEQIDWASQRLYSDESEESALSRLPIYYAAIRMFIAKPIFGWGYGNFDLYDRQFQGRVGDLVNPEKDHASHNLYLSLLAEQGLIGFLLYLAPIAWHFVLSVFKLPRMPTAGLKGRNLLVILWLAVAYFVVINNFFNVIVVYSLGMYWMLLGMIATLVRPTTREESAEPQVLKSRLLHNFQIG